MIHLNEVASDVAESMGNDLKDSDYLNRIQAATPFNKLNKHPRHFGIKMQAHHAISAKGIKLSMQGKKLKDFDYDINLLPNLVFIPCTLKGACYLGVQPHRGDHSTYTPSIRNDDEHPVNYHEMVSRLVKTLLRKFHKECVAEGPNLKHRLRELMDGLSEQIIDNIQHDPEKAQLTRLWMYFAPGNKIGCGNVENVGKHKGQACTENRNHKKSSNGTPEELNITFVSNGKYKLAPGK
jgi:hypothetical protein